MDRQTRKQLKTDKFAQDLGNTFSFLSDHRSETIRYGLIAVAVIILGVGYYYYSRSQAAAREEALEKAMQVDQAIIAANPTPTNINFPTQAEKDKARTQAFSDLATKYHGTAEGRRWRHLHRRRAIRQRKFCCCGEDLQGCDGFGPAGLLRSGAYVPGARVCRRSKIPEAEKLLRYLMDHPTASGLQGRGHA